MKMLIHAVVLLCLSLGLTGIHQVDSQTDAPEITLLDGAGNPISSLVDGNRVQLRIKLGAVEDAKIGIRFSSPDLTKHIAECTIQAGMDSCETEPFDALGWYWGADGNATPQRTITASVNESQVIGSLPVSVAPRPVVMVHGFNSNAQAWESYLGSQGYLAELSLQGFAVGDGQVPGVMNTGSVTNPAVRTNTIAQNAAILGEYIDHVQEATGAEQVDLLVHSMGGMISRYYIDRVMSGDDVAQLIILGTPMGGSACSILPASLGLLLPASLEIQPSYMTGVFNQQIVRRKGVPFHALAGTRLRDEVASPCTPIPSDVVVTVDSVRAIPMPVEEIPLLHTELNTSREVFAGFVTQRLKTPPDRFEIIPDPPAGTNAPASQQFSRVFTGHLNPGETQDVVINIDPNVTVANFALYDTSRSLTIVVTGASGQQLQLDPVANGILRIDDPSTMIYLGYGFERPRPGRWVVTLKTSDTTPAFGADFAITAKFNGGALLQTTQDVTVPRVNETVTISAVLTADGAAIPLTSAIATLRQPDGSAQTLEMTVSGNQAELKVAPHMSGIHGVEVNVLANSADGNVIDRAAFLSFEAQPTTLETRTNRMIALLLGTALLFAILALVWIRRRKKVL